MVTFSPRVSAMAGTTAILGGLGWGSLLSSLSVCLSSSLSPFSLGAASPSQCGLFMWSLQWGNWTFYMAAQGSQKCKNQF